MADEKLGIRIEIEEVDNGFVVNFFSMRGSIKFDKGVYYKTLPEVFKAIDDWLKELRKGEA